jgi:hypothetical protein
MENIKDILKKLPYSIFTSSLFFGIFFLFYNSNSEMNVTALILLLVLFFPLILSGLWLGYTAIAIPLICASAISFIDPIITIILLVFFIIPSSLLVLITRNPIVNKYCSPLVFIIFYIIVINTVVLTYLSYSIDSSIYSYLYDLFTFLSISIISSNKDIFEGVDTTNTIKIISLIIPAISSFLWIAWINMNYKLALLVISKTEVSDKNTNNNIFLPSWYTYVFIIIAVSTLLINKIFVDAENLCYTLYNILLVLWICYFYPGYSIAWTLVKSRKSILLELLFIAFFVFAFVEIMLLISFIGFLENLHVFRKYKKN